MGHAAARAVAIPQPQELIRTSIKRFKIISIVCTVTVPPRLPALSFAFRQIVSSRACSRKSWPFGG